MSTLSSSAPSAPVEDISTVTAHFATYLARFRSLQQQLVAQLQQVHLLRKVERERTSDVSTETNMTDASSSPTTTTTTTNTSFHSLTRDISLLFLELRSLSRKLVAHDLKLRGLVESAKIQCDLSRLDLESLTYELNYFQDELNYKSTSLENIKARQLQEAKLIDEEVFKKEYTGPEPTNQHQYTLARLDHELKTRRALHTQIVSLKSSNEQLSQKLTSQRDLHTKFIQQLKTISDAAHSAAVEYFGDNAGELLPEVSSSTQQQAQAHLLPSPLYTLFKNATIYLKNAPNGLLSRVEILGDVSRAEQFAKDGGAAEATLAQEAAKEKEKKQDTEMKQPESKSSNNETDKTQTNPTAQSNTNPSEDTDADAAAAAILNDDMSDANASTVETSAAANNNSTNSSTTNSSADLSSFVWSHPLHLRLTFRIQSEREEFSKDILQLTFYYMPILKVVTVSHSVLSLPTAFTSTSIFSSFLARSLLVRLLPEDDGTQLPNDIFALLHPRTAVLVKQHLNLETLISSYGRPYRWAQTLCGLHYPTTTNQSAAQQQPQQQQQSLSFSLASLLPTLNSRLYSHFALLQQLTCLISNQHHQSGASYFFGLVTSGQYMNFPLPPQAKLKQVVPTVQGDDLHVSCLLSAGSSQLEASISISAEYPACPPLFKLSYLHATNMTFVPNTLVLSTADKHALELAKASTTNAQVFDNNLKEIEMEVNTRFPVSLRKLAQVERMTFQSLFNSETHTFQLTQPQAAFGLLSYQLRKLHGCFDILQESQNSGSQGQEEERRGKLFARATRGRDRRKPLVYDAQQQLWDQQ